MVDTSTEVGYIQAATMYDDTPTKDMHQESQGIKSPAVLKTVSAYAAPPFFDLTTASMTLLQLLLPIP